MSKYKNNNLLKREILSIFKNAKYLEIYCYDYPLSLESLLSLIVDTKIKEVVIKGYFWVPSLKNFSSFNIIINEYKKSNFNLEFEYDVCKGLKITYIQ